jgi:hypothetical protein
LGGFFIHKMRTTKSRDIIPARCLTAQTIRVWTVFDDQSLDLVFDPGVGPTSGQGVGFADFHVR